MFASLAGQGGQSDSEGETDEEDEAMPPLERIGDHRADDWPLPLMFDSDTDAEMPPLASVSNSSDSEGSEEEEEEDGESSSDGLDDASDERMPTVRPFDLVFDPGMEARNEARNENAGMFVRLSSLWGAAAVREADASSAPESSTRAVNAATGVDVGEEDYADDEADMPPLEHEPPFVTDGRGRVVWSSSSDSGYPRANSSAPRRASGTFPGAFPSGPSSRAMPAEKPPSPRQATGEGGFTTDGRGRVIGTTGTREGEDDETEDSTSEAPVPTRSFFGRVLDAFF
jgi:E3 ubiquitin-protein ligase makorin